MSKYYSYTLNEYRLKRVLIILLSKTVCGRITLFQLEITDLFTGQMEKNYFNTPSLHNNFENKPKMI